MTRKSITLLLALMLVATPATPFWAAFFAGIGKAVGKAIGFGSSTGGLSGLMPVSVKAAKPVVDAAKERLTQLQGIHTTARSTLDHYAGVAGTLRDLGRLDRFRAPAGDWFRSRSADRYGTSGLWIRVVNGDAGRRRAVSAYARASAPVPDWTGALRTLPSDLRSAVRREHASLELADAASLRSMTVLGEVRRHAARRSRAHLELERAVLDPGQASHSMPALLGKVSVGQVRQVQGTEQTNQLLDALLEAEVAGLKRERDRLARSMESAAAYRARAAAVPLPRWRMP